MIRVSFFSVLLAGLLLLASAVHAASIAVSGGSDSALGVQVGASLLPTLQANLGYLHTGSDHGDADIYGAGLMIAPPTPLLHWGIGARYQYQDTRYGSGGGVALGASVFVDTPLPLLSVGGYGFYMPSGLAHGDIRHSSDYGAQLRLGLSHGIYAYAGYRWLRTAFVGTGTHALYKGPAIGASVGF